MTVAVGQYWEFVGPNPVRNRPLRRSEQYRGLYVVHAKNTNPEAGPDSWVMRHTETGLTLYMHRDRRAEGVWVRRIGLELNAWRVKVSS